MQPSCIRSFIVVLSFLLLGTKITAQLHTVLVKPSLTDARIETIHGEHVAMINKSAPSKHRLVLMIGGTGAAATEFIPFDSLIAELGYALITLDYSNNVITTTCSNSNDSACFNTFRQEIVFGTPVSSIVSVDSVNSLYFRFLQLLHYLVKQDPGQGWEEYLHGNTIQWDRIITAGHSQGAGHAAYLGKKYRLAGVMIFSGPQDYLGVFHRPAGWLSGHGLTDPSRYVAFLHVDDQYDSRKQLANCETLMQLPTPDTTLVKPLEPVTGHMPILITNMPAPNAHLSTLDPRFRKVWEYMLRKVSS